MVVMMTQDPPVEKLVQMAQGGDDAAFGELVKLYQRRVEALAASRMSPTLRRKLTVDDVVQESFTRALESLRSFSWQGEDSFMRWLGADESQQGNHDLNADGDSSDRVIHVHDLETGETKNLELATLLVAIRLYPGIGSCSSSLNKEPT